MQTKFLYVYILQCADNSFYVGVTNNPERRLKEHNSGVNPTAYTATRKPVQMVYCEKFSDFMLAIDWEKRLKKWSHKKKKALIEKNYEALKEFSKCNNETSHNLFSLLDSARKDARRDI